MSGNRIIKKYPNRRLYDTAISQYITIEDVKNLVLNDIKFNVIDAKSKEDLTRSVLMHIIAEQEHGDNPIFSTNSLIKIIHAYANSDHYFLSGYIGKCLESFTHLRKKFKNELGNKSNPKLADLSVPPTELNQKLWKKIEDNFFNTDDESVSKSN